MHQAEKTGPGRTQAGRPLIASIRELVGILKRAEDRRTRRRALLLVTLVGAVISANTVAQTWLNSWQGSFYDSIEGRDVTEFLRQILVYIVLAGTLLVLVVAQTWGVEQLKIALRRLITTRLLDSWLVPKRAYLLAFAGDAGANPDQRIHDDTRRLAELSADLGASLFQSSLLLVTFVGVLWVLSDQVGFPIGGEIVIIPGSMVWCAVAFASAGSWFTWRFGRPLVELNSRRYEREAELRLGLVRVNEAAEGITLYGGERDERRTIDRSAGAVFDAMALLAGQVARLTWVTSGYGWLALVVPIFAAAPGYFAGTLSLGGLMMVVNAFNQVQSSLRWFVDNFQRIADWQAALLRVAATEAALESLARTNGGDGHIAVEADADRLSIEALSVNLTGGPATLDQEVVEAGPGDRILLVGEPHAGKSMVFLALAGLWTHGRGRVRMPPRDRVMFMPERPYLPAAALGAVLAYPHDRRSFSDETLAKALIESGLGHLRGELDFERRWDHTLSLDEQQMLAFARLLLHRPDWAFLDDAGSALDSEQLRGVLATIRRTLPGTAVIGTSRKPDRLDFYDRIVHVRRLRARP